MRRFYALLAFLSACSVLFAQSPAAENSPVKPDERLFEAFDSAFVFKALEANPMLVRRWNFYLDHAFVLMDFPAEKGDIAALPTVDIADPTHLNILLLEKQRPLAHDWDTPVFYRVNKSNQALMLLPGRLFMERFRKSLDAEN